MKLLDECRRLHEAGLTPTEIVKALPGYSDGYIYRVLVRVRGTTRTTGAKWSPEELETLRTMASDGKTVGEISEVIGRTPSSIGTKLANAFPALKKWRESDRGRRESRRNTETMARVRVYETALGLTREQLRAKLPDMTTAEIDRYLNQCLTPWRVDGDTLEPTLTIREKDGVFVRTRDIDMFHKDDSPRLGATAVPVKRRVA